MHKLPKLEFDYSDLQPHISASIMELHHSKHHQGYIDKLNLAIEGTEFDSIELSELLTIDLPNDIQQIVINQGGGHFNHSLFWQWLSPNGGGQPKGDLARAIDDHYGSFQGLVDAFSDKSAGLFGSGWCWLMPDLSIKTTANQDNPIMDGHPMPILGNDIWEHAYYLDYQNRRADYIKAWWNIVNWDRVEYLYGLKG